MEKKNRIIIGIIVIANFLALYILNNNNNNVVEIDEMFYNCKIDKKQEKSYLGILEILSINLKKEFYDLDSIYNQVDQNITLINESTMPDEDNGNIILAAHRGNSKVAFFNNLHKIEPNDEINIYFNNKKYVYKYSNRYDVEKNGKIKIIREKNKTTITLITCKKWTNKQTVFIGYLVDIVDMSNCVN